MEYEVRKTETPPTAVPDWHGSTWEDIEPVELRNFLGSRPGHFPRVQVKMAYDESALHIIFRVLDQYVIARETSDQNAVCQDSCVEFFFTPGPDPSEGYFNLEANCIGTRLVRYQTAPGQNKNPLKPEHLGMIRTTSTLKSAPGGEITEPVTWLLQHSVHYRALDPYARINRPSPGGQWRANLYKCADNSSHPHWLCWAPINTGQFSYHAPSQFGTLSFLPA